MKLEHLFIRRCIDPVALLLDCQKVSTFCGRLERQAKKYADGDEDLQNQYKGGGLNSLSNVF